MPSARVFSTVSDLAFPDLYKDLVGLPSSAHGKRLVYLANLGLQVEKGLFPNLDRLSHLLLKMDKELLPILNALIEVNPPNDLAQSVHPHVESQCDEADIHVGSPKKGAENRSTRRRRPAKFSI
jgi:hypothetical protein